MRLFDELNDCGQKIEDRARRAMATAEHELSEFADRAGDELRSLATEARVDFSDWETRARDGFREFRVRLADWLEEPPPPTAEARDPAPKTE